MVKVKPNNKKNSEKIDWSKIPIEIIDSFYTNGVRVTYSDTEFSIDFFQQPKNENNNFRGMRIYITPQNLKLFTKVFQEQLNNHEKKFAEKKP